MNFFFFNDTATTEIYTLSLHDALPILRPARSGPQDAAVRHPGDPSPRRALRHGARDRPRPLWGRPRVRPDRVDRAATRLPGARPHPGPPPWRPGGAASPSHPPPPPRGG